MTKQSESGGVVLDMHIHDIDVALWWFGKPERIAATGLARAGLVTLVDATWIYKDGLLVQIHGAWDDNQTTFKAGFKVILEEATLEMDAAKGGVLQLLVAGAEPKNLEYDPTLAYQREIDDLIDAVATNRPITRVTPEASGLAVSIALDEIRQIVDRA